MTNRCKGDVVGRILNVANLWEQGVSDFEKVQRLTISESNVAGIRA